MDYNQTNYVKRVKENIVNQIIKYNFVFSLFDLTHLVLFEMVARFD